MFGMLIPEVEVLFQEPHKVCTMVVCNTKVCMQHNETYNKLKQKQRDTQHCVHLVWLLNATQRDVQQVETEARKTRKRHTRFLYTCLNTYIHVCGMRMYLAYSSYLYERSENTLKQHESYLYTHVYVNTYPRVMQMVFGQCGSRVCVTRLIHMCDISDGYSQLKKRGPGVG